MEAVVQAFLVTVKRCHHKSFHHYASSRKRKNQITQLVDGNGVVCLWEDGIPGLILQYFSNMFWSQGCTNENIIEVVPCRVTQEQNEFLERPYSTEEIRTAIMGMHPNKSPGPDGMNPSFSKSIGI